MVKKNKLILPIDIINIIVEYSVNKCDRCERENIRKYYAYRIYALGNMFFGPSICYKCSILCIKNNKELDYENIMRDFYYKIYQSNKILNLGKGRRKDLLIIAEKKIKNQIKQRIKEDIIEILKRDYIYHRFASKKEIYKILFDG